VVSAPGHDRRVWWNGRIRKATARKERRKKVRHGGRRGNHTIFSNLKSHSSPGKTPRGQKKKGKDVEKRKARRKGNRTKAIVKRRARKGWGTATNRGAREKSWLQRSTGKRRDFPQSSTSNADKSRKKKKIPQQKVRRKRVQKNHEK